MQRRDFLSRSALAAMLASGVAPAAITARDKSDKTNPIIGDGDYKYECHHNWGELPKALVWQDDQGKVWLTFNSGEYLQNYVYPRHGLPSNPAAVQALFHARLNDVMGLPWRHSDQGRFSIAPSASAISAERSRSVPRAAKRSRMSPRTMVRFDWSCFVASATSATARARSGQ